MVLPVVRQSVAMKIRDELLAEQGYTAELLKRVAEENPIVANFIATFAVDSSDATSVLTCALLVYRLLEKQSELN
jgi:hypothetical protein